MNSGNSKSHIYNGLAIAAVMAVLAFIFFRQGNDTDSTAEALDVICNEAANGDHLQAAKWIEAFDTEGMDAVSLAKLSIACMQVADNGGDETLTARAVSLYNRALKTDRAKAHAFFNNPPAGQEHLVEMLTTLAGNLANPVDASIEHDIDPEMQTQTPVTQ